MYNKHARKDEQAKNEIEIANVCKPLASPTLTVADIAATPPDLAENSQRLQVQFHFSFLFDLVLWCCDCNCGDWVEFGGLGFYWVRIRQNLVRVSCGTQCRL